MAASLPPQKYTRGHTVGLVLAPFSGGQPRGGVEHGPNQLLENGLAKQLRALGWTVEGDGPDAMPDFESLRPAKELVHGILKNPLFVSRVTQKIHELVKKTCAEGKVALTLGGDHSIGMGTVSGSAAVHDNLGVIWVDAHADINTADTTESGNLHGCPMSFVMGIGPKVEAFSWLKPCLRPSRIVYIGLRDVDQGEKRILRENGIKAFSMHEVDKYGIGRVMELAIAHLGADCPIHLSFDVDALDPSVAPATGTPVRGGLSFREGHYICESIFETGRLVSMDIMEVNPQLGADHASLVQTIQVGCSLVRSALGETLL
ncbi:Arginase, catabolizes arginine to ornithine and urea [Polyrhizophydium stewartii]|uniref:Arginase n=1 Tax=Polyrhizophydium stewartii TaxID=2732419 RepID=A0ABR4N3N3_9FUNG